jgi:hypothetical protein
MADLPPVDQMPDEFPLTLAEACAVFFRDRIKPGSLRAARARGELLITRAGRRDWVTAGGIKEMMRRWPDPQKDRDSISTQKSEYGSSETERGQYALAALNQTLKELKGSLGRTSAPSSGRPSAKVISMQSTSPKS